MRITDSRAVLFESPDPVTPTPPAGALDVVMLLDRHRIPWRTLPHRPTALTVRRAARDTAAQLRGVLLIACTDQGAMAGLRAGAIVAPVPPDGDIGGLIDRVEPGLPVPDPDDACGAPGARGVRSAVSGLGRWFCATGLRITGSVARQWGP